MLKLLLLLVFFVTSTLGSQWTSSTAPYFQQKWSGNCQSNVVEVSTTSRSHISYDYWTPRGNHGAGSTVCTEGMTVSTGSFNLLSSYPPKTATSVSLTFILIDALGASNLSSLIVRSVESASTVATFKRSSPLSRSAALSAALVTCTIGISSIDTLVFNVTSYGQGGGVVYLPYSLTATDSGSVSNTCNDALAPLTATYSASEHASQTQSISPSASTPASKSMFTSASSDWTATNSGTSHITKSNSLTLSSSRPASTPSLSTTHCVFPARVRKTITKSTSPDIQSLSQRVSLTPSPALLPASPPPTEPPPVAVASQAIVTTVIVSSTLVAASAAGGAVMQAALSAAACAKDDDAADEAPGMSMYIVSPFVGNDYGMVYGNMALVAACCLLHVGAAMTIRRIPYFAASNTRAAMAAVRFPHATLLFAGLAVQGVLLGGWQALWVVVRNEADGGEVVALLLTFVASVLYGVGLIYFLVRMRRALCLPLVSSSRPFEANLLQSGSVLQAHLVADYNVENVASCAPCSLVWGPQNIWTPNDYRRMYGVSFNDYHGISAHQERWLIASVAGLPWLVAAASATRPDRASRLMVCNGVMLLVGLLLLLHAACVVWFAPLRVRVRNPIAALVVVWMSVTCVLSSPLLRDAVGGDDTTGTILSVIGVLQGATILSQILVELWSYYAVERYVLRAVTERDDAQLHLLDEEEEEMLPVVDDTAGLKKLDESDAGMDDAQVDLNDVEFGVDDSEEEVDGCFDGLHGPKEAADSELQHFYGNWSLR